MWARPAARKLDAVQERVHRGSTALDPAPEAVATGAPVVRRRIDCLRRATFDHLSLDAAALQRPVLERRGDCGPDLDDGRCFGGILELGHGAPSSGLIGGRLPPAERTPRPALQALAKRPDDGVASRAHPELGLQAFEPLADRMQAEEQLPREFGLALDDDGRAQHLALPRGQAEAVEGVRAEARHRLLEQQCMRIAWDQADREAPAVALADQRRARGEGGPPGDPPGEPTGGG